jgi:transglutaminase-like putative cysteine protease
MVRSPYRIGNPAVQGRIRYRFSFRDDIAFALPQTGEQRVSESGDGVTVEICADCGPGLSGDRSSLAEALRPTAWLQSDHPRLRTIAAPVARRAIPDAQRMQVLARRVRELMPLVDFTGHFSALDTLSRGAGDCTEAAVLLAALGRAAGIPTRVVSGLVYSRERYHGVSNVFMPHSWVIAWVDGEWRSFDAALDNFDATHIALTIGDGDDRQIGAAIQLAGLLQWQAMTEVRPRPAD